MFRVPEFLFLVSESFSFVFSYRIHFLPAYSQQLESLLIAVHQSCALPSPPPFTRGHLLQRFPSVPGGSDETLVNAHLRVRLTCFQAAGSKLRVK